MKLTHSHTSEILSNYTSSIKGLVTLQSIPLSMYIAVGTCICGELLDALHTMQQCLFRTLFLCLCLLVSIKWRNFEAEI